MPSVTWWNDNDVVAVEDDDVPPPEPEQVTCEGCRTSGHPDDLEVEHVGPRVNADLCSECRANLVWCDRCTSPDWSDEAQWVDGGMYVFCRQCVSWHVSWCDPCDDYRTDYPDCHDGCPDYCDCDDCRYDDESSSVHINSYSYKPAPVFHPQGPCEVCTRFAAQWPQAQVAACAFGGAIPGELYIGMELEMEVPRGDRNSIAATLASALPEDEGYLKDDGSLEYGIEYVTHPMSLKYAMGNLPWAALAEVRRAGARSWNASTCGMHLHVSRSAFTDSHLWKFMHFHHRNAAKCQKVAGRGSVGYAQWDESEKHNVLKYVKKQSRNRDRYVALNVQNEHTVELRYFKGTLDPNGIRRNWQFVHAIWAYTKQLTYAQVRDGGLEWAAFVAWLDGRDEYAHLIAALVSKGIYR